MFRVRWGCLPCLVGALVPACLQAQPAPAVEVARSFIAAVAAGDVTDIDKRESAQLRAALPAAKLNGIWLSLQGRYGSFSSCKVTAATPRGGRQSIAMDCSFKTHIVPLEVTVDNAAVAGIFLREPRPVAPAEAKGDQTLRFGSPGWLLPGTLTRPPTANPLAVVVMLHGSGPQDRDGRVGETAILRDLAIQLAGGNIASLRFEKRTRQHGLRLAAQPEITLEEEVIDDALSAVSTVATQPDLTNTCTILLGHSQGAFLAPYIYGKKRERRIDGLVLLASPGRPLAAVVLDQVKFLVGDPGSDETAVAVLQTERRKLERLLAAPDIAAIPAAELPRTISASSWGFFSRYDAIREWQKSRPPTLALFAEKDYQVTRADWRAWVEAARSEPMLQVALIPDASHVFTPVHGAPSPKNYQSKQTVIKEVGRKIIEFAQQRCPAQNGV